MTWDKKLTATYILEVFMPALCGLKSTGLSLSSLPHMYIANHKLLWVHLVNNTLYTVILLPLRSTSLMHKNPQRCKINHGMCPMGRKHWSIDLKMSFVEYPVCVISVAVIMAVVKLGIFLLTFVVL